MLEEPLDLLGRGRAMRRARRSSIASRCGSRTCSALTCADDEIVARAEAAAKACAARSEPTIVVSNEVGSGIVPMHPVARRYRDVLGRVNAIFADEAAHRRLDGRRPRDAIVNQVDRSGGTVMSLLASLLTDLPEADEGARDAVAERAASVLRPTGALARLDEVAAWLAAWQRTERPAVDAPHAVVFAADHGVAAAAGVSAYPDRGHRRDARRAGEGRGHRCRDDQGPGDDARRGRRRRRAPDRRPAVRAGDGRGAFRRGRPGGRRCSRAQPRPRICSSSARWGSGTRPPPRPWPRPCTTSPRPSGADAGRGSTTMGWRARSKR